MSDRTGVTDADDASSSDDDDEAEDEDISTLPDNFSDVLPISANDSVSARGSPSLSISGERISGRAESNDSRNDSRVCTPFSGNALEQNGKSHIIILYVLKAFLGGEALITNNENRKNLPPPLLLPVTVRKQNPDGLEEKFGKFSLPPQEPSKYSKSIFS